MAEKRDGNFKVARKLLRRATEVRRRRRRGVVVAATDSDLWR